MAADAQPGIRLLPRHSMLARMLWLSVCALFLAAFMVNQGLLYSELHQACAHVGCEEEQFYLTAGEIAALRASGYSVSLYAGFQVGMYTLIFLVNVGLATLIFWRGADDRMALLTATALLLWGGTFAYTPDSLWQAAPPVAAFLSLVDKLAGPSFFALCLFFPNARFAPPFLRWFAVALTLCSLAVSLLATLGLTTLAQSIQPILGAIFVITAIVTQLYRYRRLSTPVERQQTRWAVFGIITSLSWVAAVALVFVANPALEQGALNKALFNGLIYSGFLLVPLSIGVAILRSRLWDIDVLINRALVYGALTACVIALYVVVVGYLALLFSAEQNLPISILATGVVAVLVQPLRGWLQRGANRLLYGERGDPYSVLARLGQRLEESLTPETALPTIVETVAQTLKLPYVAIALDGDQADAARAGGAASAIAAEAGNAPPGTAYHRVPLAYQGEPAGQLILAPRPGEKELSAPDRRLLAGVARHAGVVVHAARLQNDLRRSHEQIIAAREEERRRLRRDLHDGLGPALATLVVQVEAARELLASEPAAADVLLADVTSQAQEAIGDVRRLVYALRPPALDDLGLVGALRAYAARHVGTDVAIEVEAPDQLPPLPAAVEVAAYRIVQEALVNVLRHARATRCRVTLSVAGVEPRQSLAIGIGDDGIGLASGHSPGVGLAAMRERAAEVGGTCAISAPAHGGTRVDACLPIQ